MQQLGLGTPPSWLSTIGFAVGWLALMLAYSPIADRLATRLVSKPPNLGAFAALRQSRSRLLIGIVAAWVLGGFLEELLLRGIMLQWVERLISNRLDAAIAAAIGICAAALIAGVLHLYQGLRAAIIITQLSILFGLLFVAAGHNLWTVMLCHGLYDTIAFVRFAQRKSKYSRLDAGFLRVGER
jgi:uncharacterized protein